MEEKKSKTTISWEALIDPVILKPKLINASLLVLSYENLKATLINKFQDFFTIGIEEKDFIYSDDYHKLISKSKNSILYASIAWSLKMNAISEGDVELHEECKKMRNKISHELPKVLLEGLPSNLESILKRTLMLIKKIENWYIINVEIQTDPDLYDKEIHEESVRSINDLTLELIQYVSTSPNTEGEELLKKWKAHINNLN